MILNATVGAADANSFLTRAEALDILTTRRLHSAKWTSSTTAQQDAALIWATRILSDAFRWDGGVRTLEQALPWPRSGMLDADGRYLDQDQIPERLKEATADLALALLQRDRMSDPDLLGLGFSSAGVGSLRVTIDPKMVLEIVPRHVLMSLSLWGTIVSPGVTGMRTLPIERT